MKKSLFACLSILLFLCSSCSTNRKTVSSESLPSQTIEKPAKPAANETIRFFEERIKNNPEDLIAYNKLASEYLQQMRETGDVNYLNLAERAAQSSLEVLPPHQNKEALALLALVKYASHDFAASRDFARQLIELEPNKGYTYQILGDALFELGDYAEAEKAYAEMDALGGIQTLTKAAIEQRLARVAALKGDSNGAKKYYASALKLIQSTPAPPAESAAYCHWQLGETAFSVGDYEQAEKHYKNALDVYPNYTSALASMGKVRAARGDLAAGIDFYERAVARLPNIAFVGALGDLYKSAGKETEAQNQYKLVEQIARLDETSGSLYNRELALFYADHDLKAEEAYQLALKEYETRRDIYGSDALAWTALKAGKIAEAKEKITEALRFNTKDARLFYHAGMIFRATGDQTEARKNLQNALKLNPKFNPLQAEIGKRTIESF